MSDGSAARYIGGVLLAACCWGMIGTSYALFRRWFDVDELTLVTLRALSAVMVLVLWWGVTGRRLDIPSRRDVGALALLGFVAVTCFYLSLIYAFTYTSVSVATLLLYLAPTIVNLGAALFLAEPLTRPCVIALAVSLAGCGLIVEIYRPANLEGNLLGIGFCLAAAVTYASYSLLSKPMMLRMPSETIVLGHLAFGAAGLLLIKLIASPAVWPPALGLIIIGLHCGVVLTLIPVISYTYGLRGLPTGEASIIATLEPVVAMALASVVLHERLTAPQLLGASCVLGSVMLLATGRRGPGVSRIPARGSLPS